MIALRLLPATVVGLVLLFLAFPILVVVVVSFSSEPYLTFPPPGFGLRWYEPISAMPTGYARPGSACGWRRQP